jgi:hypothetical protein
MGATLKQHPLDLSTSITSILGLVGYDARLTRERSRVQSSEDVLLCMYFCCNMLCTSGCVYINIIYIYMHTTYYTNMKSILGLVGYDARLTRERSRVQSSEDVFFHSDAEIK